MKTRAVVLSPLAEDDLSGIAAWTAAQFGDRQATAYVEAIISTIEELATDDLNPLSNGRNPLEKSADGSALSIGNIIAAKGYLEMLEKWDKSAAAKLAAEIKAAER